MVKKTLKKILERIKFLKYSFNKNIKSCKYILQSDTKMESIEYQILLYVHSIEKGLTFKKIRYGFGRKKIEELLKFIKEYIYLDYDMDRYAIQAGMIAIESYIKFHKEVSYDISWLEKEYNTFKEYIKHYVNVGTHCYDKEELINNKDFLFEDFISRRHSIRSFSKEEVTENEIKKALKLAQNAPSACNRQPIKVYYSLNKEKNAIIDEIIPGNSGFMGNVDKYLIITSDVSAFGGNEINQWYVNGGIYCSFLVLALHSLGIGTCIFQWAYDKSKEKKLRKLANIRENEEIIIVVGIGKYEEKISVPIGCRKRIEEISYKF